MTELLPPPPPPPQKKRVNLQVRQYLDWKLTNQFYYIYIYIFFLLGVGIRGGFGSGGSGFGEIRCPSVENKFMDNPSANRPLIGSGGRVG